MQCRHCRTPGCDRLCLGRGVKEEPSLWTLCETLGKWLVLEERTPSKTLHRISVKSGSPSFYLLLPPGAGALGPEALHSGEPAPPRSSLVLRADQSELASAHLHRAASGGRSLSPSRTAYRALLPPGSPKSRLQSTRRAPGIRRHTGAGYRWELTPLFLAMSLFSKARRSQVAMNKYKVTKSTSISLRGHQEYVDI